MNIITYFSNVVTGRFGHYNDARDRFINYVWYEVEKYPEPIKAFYRNLCKSIIFIVEELIGPQKGNKRLIKIDPLKISKKKINTIFGYTLATLVSVYLKINNNSKSEILKSYEDIAKSKLENTALFKQIMKAQKVDVTTFAYDYYNFITKDILGLSSNEILEWIYIAPILTSAYLSFIEGFKEDINL